MSREIKIRYIKANGKYYHPQKAGEQMMPLSKYRKGAFISICFIKKLWFGRWQIDFYDKMHWVGYSTDNQKPNTRLIIYPNGIEEISYNVTPDINTIE